MLTSTVLHCLVAPGSLAQHPNAKKFGGAQTAPVASAVAQGPLEQRMAPGDSKNAIEGSMGPRGPEGPRHRSSEQYLGIFRSPIPTPKKTFQNGRKCLSFFYKSRLSNFLLTSPCGIRVSSSRDISYSLRGTMANTPRGYGIQY